MKSKTWLCWTTADTNREASKVDSKITLALGTNPSKWKVEVGEMTRQLASIKTQVIETATALNESRQLETQLQTHLNALNEVIEGSELGFKIGMSLMEKMDNRPRMDTRDNKRGDPRERDSTQPKNGPCYLCGSRFHWVRNCPEKVTN